MRVLTPVVGGVRIRLEVSEADAAKVKRGRAWRATVTDIPTGKRWQLRDRSCGLAECRCDASAKLVTK